MRDLTYTRYELVRILRNRRFFIFSLGFPLVLYFVIAGPNRNVDDFIGTGVSAPLYYMVGLAAFGTMSSMLSAGTRISAERAAGWNRQLRITPLTTRSYFRAKVVTAYLVSLLTVGVLYVSGVALGVRLPASTWLEMTGLLIVGLIPFAILGIVMGHLLNSDTVGAAVGGTTGLLALISGTWFPLGNGVLHDIAQVLPSYWLVQANQVALGGHAWGALGWTVVAAWSVGLAVIAARVFRRDTERV